MQTDHQRTGNGIEGDFLRRARFQTGAAGDHFVARVEHDAAVGLHGHRRVDIIGNADRQRAGPTRGAQGAQHIWRGAGRGQQEHHVVGLRQQGQQVGRTLRRIVFRPFDGREHGAGAAGKNGHGALGRPGKSRVQFHAVEHAQPARGAGTDIQEPATGGDTGQGGRNRRRDVWRSQPYGFDGPELVIDQGGHQLRGWIQIEFGMPRARGFSF